MTSLEIGDAFLSCRRHLIGYRYPAWKMGKRPSFLPPTSAVNLRSTGNSIFEAHLVKIRMEEEKHRYNTSVFQRKKFCLPAGALLPLNESSGLGPDCLVCSRFCGAVNQPLDRNSSEKVLAKDRVRVFGSYSAVPDILRVNCHQGAVTALIKASCLVDPDLLGQTGLSH